jgi:hypothetical protein
MSITLGLYDLYANLIPGLLYLYIINDALFKFKQVYIDLAQLDKLPNLILVTAAAFVLGHIFNDISYRYWYRKLSPKTPDTLAIEHLKSQYPEIPILYKINETKLLLGIIRHNNMSLANLIEKHNANFIMLRNISLGLCLYALLQLIVILQTGTAFPYLTQMILAIVLSALAFRRCQNYDRWYNRDIIREALNYGSSLSEVLSISRRIVLQNATGKNTDVEPNDELE